MTMHHTPISTAAKLSCAQQSERPAAPEPTEPSTAMGAMAQALGGAEESRGNVGFADDSRAGEEADEKGVDGPALRHRELAVQIGRRIVAVREMTGLQQLEFSRAIGHRTSAQPSLWEAGRRLLPITELVNVSKALGVSSDFILGLSSEMERDPVAARRALLTLHLRDQLETVTGHLADTLLESTAEVDGVLRATGLLSKVGALVQAVSRFRAANESLFQELRGGAWLERTSQELEEAAATVGAELDAVAKRRERAAHRAKLAMSGGSL